MSLENGEQGPCELDAMGAFSLAMALSAAQATGLLGMVLDSCRSAPECAAELRLDARIVGSVLDVLVAAGLLEKRGDRYGVRTSGQEATRLTPARYQTLKEHLGYTEQALRGEPLRAWVDGGAERREAAYSTLATEMGSMYSQLAGRLAAQIRTSPRRILDVGCGSGVWSLEIARNTPGARVVGLDFPAVLEGFFKRARQLGLEELSVGLPGDLHTIALPDEPFDMVILANLLRLEPPERAEHIVTRMASVLRPGGHLLVIDALAAGTPAKELSRAGYGLMLALRTSVGRVYSAQEIEGWMTRAGIAHIKMIDCGPSIGAVGALLGQRPELV